jgi:tetratricopeptide (TPR) repeat protein
VQRYFITQPEYGAYAVLEYADTLSKPMGFQFQLKAAEALVRTGDLESACKVLQPLSGYEASEGLLAEKGLALYLRLCLDLDRGDEAGEATRLFHARFPKSRFIHEINAALQKKPGEIFKRASSAAVSSPGEQGPAREQKEADRLGTIAFVERLFADPVFWVLLLFLNIAAPILTPGLSAGPFSPVYLFTGAFLMTIVHRMGSLADLWYQLGAPSEKKVLQEVALQRSYDDAVMAERKEQYAEAASLYERMLAADPRHIQARFNLARLYQNKLNSAATARKHYRLLTEHLPKDHPYRHDAETALK